MKEGRKGPAIEQGRIKLPPTEREEIIKSTKNKKSDYSVAEDLTQEEAEKKHGEQWGRAGVGSSSSSSAKATGKMKFMKNWNDLSYFFLKKSITSCNIPLSKDCINIRK